MICQEKALPFIRTVGLEMLHSLNNCKQFPSGDTNIVLRGGENLAVVCNDSLAALLHLEQHGSYSVSTDVSIQNVLLLGV